MEHSIYESELALTASVDFVVPLKQVGLITRAVLEAISAFYKPRRIIVVTANAEVKILKRLVPYWNVGGVVIESVAEENFFMPNFSLTLDDIKAEYDPARPGDQREPGWWIQQLIKLGAASQIQNLSNTYVVWDGDLVPTRRWKICDRDVHGRVRWYIAILQADSRSEFNTTQYANCMQALNGFEPLDPRGGGTFVAHHMVFKKSYVQQMLDGMIAHTGADPNTPWPLLIMSYSRKFYRFSEYKTYATFMERFHPDDFHYHPLTAFGEGGLRFREANNVLDKMIDSCEFSNGGLSYRQVIEYTKAHWRSFAGAETQCVLPAYIQLDHVYGLDGIDLRLDPVPPSVDDDNNGENVAPNVVPAMYALDADTLDLIYGHDSASSRLSRRPAAQVVRRTSSSRGGGSSEVDEEEESSNPRRTFSLTAFAYSGRTLKVRELCSGGNIPSEDLFALPVSVTVSVHNRSAQSDSSAVLSSAPAPVSTSSSAPFTRDDSSIKRVTMGSMQHAPFLQHQLVTKTTPRRPPSMRYYYCPAVAPGSTASSAPSSGPPSRAGSGVYSPTHLVELAAALQRVL